MLINRYALDTCHQYQKNTGNIALAEITLFWLNHLGPVCDSERLQACLTFRVHWGSDQQACGGGVCTASDGHCVSTRKQSKI